MNREQIEKEAAVRRVYQKRWGKLTDPAINQFYNQNFLNKAIKDSGVKELCPYQYTGHGDSYFVSKDMYNSLYATCRCGRSKSEGHIIKCLQKVKTKYLDLDTNIINTVGERIDVNGKVCADSNNSSGIISNINILQKTRQHLLEWDTETHYISPKYTVPGYKIDDHPYSTIFIG